MHFRSVSDLASAISRNIYKLPSDIEVVVGIPRSGLLAANLVALELNLPLAHLDGFAKGELLRAGSTRRLSGNLADAWSCNHALILDDSIYSGQSLRDAKALLGRSSITSRLTFGAVFAAPQALKDVDVYFELCRMPRVFGWNYLHHPALRDSCVDIDGVLCCDPTDIENDDDVNYERFLKCTRVLRNPTYEIGWLVTSRLERYRTVTEEWLARNKIKYRNLVMLDGVTAAERRTREMHASFKASVYSSVAADLFVESNLDQAREIAQLSGKPVICVETHQLVQPEGISLASSKQRIMQPVRRARTKVVRNARKIISRLCNLE